MILGYSTQQIYSNGKYLAVLNFLLNVGSEDAAVIRAGRLIHSQAAVTHNERGRVYCTISGWWEPQHIVVAEAFPPHQSSGFVSEIWGTMFWRQWKMAWLTAVTGNVFFPQLTTSAGHGADVWCDNTCAHDRQDMLAHSAQTGNDQAGDQEYQPELRWCSWVTCDQWCD